MSLALQSRFAIRSASRSAARLSVAVAPRYTSARFLSSTMHDNDPEVLETEKRRNLNKEQHRTSAPFGEHAPGWNEHLASASEAHVKADRAPASSEDLTRDTIDYLQRRHSPDDRGQSTESYAKDQVDGPLGAASYETRERIDGPLGQAQTQKTVEKDVHETTRIYKTKSVPTDSEETVKADRGEI